MLNHRHHGCGCLILVVLGVVFTVGLCLAASGAEPTYESMPEKEVKNTEPQFPVIEYADLVRAAINSKRMLMLYFCEPTAKVWGNTEPTTDYLYGQLTTDARFNGERVLSHAAFADLNGQAGMVVIDYKSVDAPYYKHVVSAIPMTKRIDVAVLSSLPCATKTQRALIYAVRVSGCQSTNGVCDARLMAAAEEHSLLQAGRGQQGHGNEMVRGGGNRAIVNESWPGQSLFDASFEMINSWRQSSGHWDACVSPHEAYGYDLKLGQNGVWYATGIFRN